MIIQKWLLHRIQFRAHTKVCLFNGRTDYIVIVKFMYSVFGYRNIWYKKGAVNHISFEIQKYNTASSHTSSMHKCSIIHQNNSTTVNNQQRLAMILNNFLWMATKIDWALHILVWMLFMRYKTIRFYYNCWCFQRNWNTYHILFGKL